MRLLWQRLEAKKHDDDDPPKRGRGSKQQKVIGALARGGLVVAKPVEKVNSKTLKASLSDAIKADDSVLITDEYEGYSRMNDERRTLPSAMLLPTLKDLYTPTRSKVFGALLSERSTDHITTTIRRTRRHISLRRAGNSTIVATQVLSSTSLQEQ